MLIINYVANIDLFCLTFSALSKKVFFSFKMYLILQELLRKGFCNVTKTVTPEADHFCIISDLVAGDRRETKDLISFVKNAGAFFRP